MEKDEDELSIKDRKNNEKLTELENEKMELVRKLYKIDETYDIDELNSIQSALLNNKKQLETQLKDDKEYKETLRPLFNEYNEKLNKYDEDEIKSNYQEYNRTQNEIKDNENSLKLNESKTKSLFKPFFS